MSGATSWETHKRRDPGEGAAGGRPRAPTGSPSLACKTKAGPRRLACRAGHKGTRKRLGRPGGDGVFDGRRCLGISTKDENCVRIE